MVIINPIVPNTIPLPERIRIDIFRPSFYNIFYMISIQLVDKYILFA